MTISPRERDQLFLADLHDLLGSYDFKRSKTRLAWKNEHSSVTVSTRGSRHSTEACSLRWLRFRVNSFVLRDLGRTGAPIRGIAHSGLPHEIRDSDFRDPPDSTGAVQLELSDRASCLNGAKRIVSTFDAFWQSEVLPWTLSPSLVIERLLICPHRGGLNCLGNPIALDPLFGSGAPAVDSEELEKLINSLAAKSKWSQHRVLAELLLACGRLDDFQRLHLYVTAVAQGSDRPSRSMPVFDDLQRWALKNAALVEKLRKTVSDE